MSIHLIAVGFAQPAPMENGDLLLYMGFNAQTEGRQIAGQLRTADLDIGIAGVHVTALQILDDQIRTEDLTIVFTDAYDHTVDGVWKMSDERKELLTKVIMSITETLDTPLLPGTYESFEAEGVSAIVVKNGGTALHKTMVDMSRMQVRSV